MRPLLAPLLGWVLGAALIAVALSMGLTGLWAPALLLGHGGLLLWGWGAWLQHPGVGQEG